MYTIWGLSKGKVKTKEYLIFGRKMLEHCWKIYSNAIKIGLLF